MMAEAFFMTMLEGNALSVLCVAVCAVIIAVVVYLFSRNLKREQAREDARNMANPYYRLEKYRKEAKARHPEVPWEHASLLTSPVAGISADECLCYKIPGTQARAVYYPSDKDFFYTDGKDRFDTADEAVRSWIKKNSPRS